MLIPLDLICSSDLFGRLNPPRFDNGKGYASDRKALLSIKPILEICVVQTISKRGLQDFDSGIDLRSILIGCLQNEDGTSITDVKHVKEVWIAINDLLDKRRLKADYGTLLLSVEKSLTEQLIITGREMHNSMLHEKKQSKRIDARIFVASYSLVGQNGMEMFIRPRNTIAEIKQAKIDDPTSDAAAVSAEKIQKLQILVDDLEISMRAGVITSAPKKGTSPEYGEH